MAQRTAAQLRPVLVLAGVILGGGLAWPVMKLGVAQVSPHAFVVVRLAIATLAAFPLAAATNALRWPRRGDWPAIATVAALQMGLFLWLITQGVALVPASRAALLAYTSPIWIAPLAPLVLGERASPATWIAFALGLAGLAVLFNPGEAVWASRAALVGNACLLGAALVWAVQIVVMRKWFRATAIRTLMPWQLLVATGLVGGVELARGTDLLAGWQGQALLAAAYSGAVATALVFAGLLYVSRTLPSMVAALGFLGVPAAGLLFSVGLLGESPGPGLWIGFGLILAALAVLARQGRRRPPRDAGSA